MKKLDAEQDQQEEYEDRVASDDSAYHIETISSMQNAGQQKLMVPLNLQPPTRKRPCIMQCEIDTGTSCNVMSKRTLNKMERNPKLQTSNTKLRMYNGDYLPVLGETTMKCVYKGVEHYLNFKIVATDKAPTQAPLLSRGTSIELGLIDIAPEVLRVHHINPEDSTTSPEDIINKYKNVFEGLGCLPGEYNIDIDKSVKPVQHMPRRVPVPLKDKLNDKIDDLVKQQIIAPVTEPTPWISSIVTVLKPDKLRICLDPRDLNQAINRSKYQTPTIDEILPDLSNAKVFTVLDAKDGFHQVKLSEESSKLTCFWTPFGRFRYLRMPFGIKSAPEEWQRRMDEIFQDLPGVKVIADDIIVYGSDMQEHNRNLVQLLERAQGVNLKFNKHKLRLGLSEVAYMGHLLTSEGIKSDPRKVQAIIDMPAPTSKHQVMTLMGMVNYGVLQPT